jgi:myo-inositol-1(or 4)-monophosphatase
MLRTAIEAAKGAGKIIRERYFSKCRISIKGFRDLVTDADIAAESFILKLIKERFPGHSVLSEEAGAAVNGSGYTWVVDPLDGTTNYAHRHPVFAVSIGVVEEGKPIIGVIHDPLRDHTFVGGKGEGATLNGAPIHVSDLAKFENAVLGVDWGHENKVRARVLSYLQPLLACCGTIRAQGSAAIGLAYVAAGWTDGYFHPALKPWDSAAGILLVEEAGGRCSTIQGSPYTIHLPDCVATNGLIHDDLLAIFKKPEEARHEL